MQTPAACKIFVQVQLTQLVFFPSVASFLSSRSWQGLEPRLGQTPVKEAVRGRRGIAIAYEDEGSS